MIERSRKRRMLVDWIKEKEPTHAITINPNEGDISINRLKKKFGQFCLEVDRMRYGKSRVSRIESDLRFQAFAFPEHLSSNAHVHVVGNFGVSFMGRKLEEDFFLKLEERWMHLSRGRAQLFVEAIDNLEGWANYITKELSRVEIDRLRMGVDFFWSADFHPNEKVVQSGTLNDILDRVNR